MIGHLSEAMKDRGDGGGEDGLVGTARPYRPPTVILLRRRVVSASGFVAVPHEDFAGRAAQVAQVDWVARVAQVVRH